MCNQDSPSDFGGIKACQQMAWSAGDYSIIGTTQIIISEDLCEATDVHAGERVLDVATGNGNTVIAAARRFCETIGIDSVPAFLEHGRQRAAVERVPVTFQEGDSEHMPFGDASFDVVLSALGIMFEPEPEKVASEVVRVCRPSGRIGLASWTPTGFFVSLSVSSIPMRLRLPD